MATVFDVAKYILRKTGTITTMKLQKLVYYCQAWSLVWDEVALFDERIEAWTSGPVVPDLYDQHRGSFKVSEYDLSLGDPDNLSKEQKKTIKAVISYYGDKTAQWLIDLSHAEDPWKEARLGVPEAQRCNREITLSAMHEYYGSLSLG